MRQMIVAVLAASLVAAGAAPAHAAVAAAGPGGFAAGFATPVVVVAKGEDLTFVNGDVAPHNVTAVDAFLSKKDAKKTKWCSGFDKGKCPLFWSQTITAGQQTPVEGLDRIEAGKQYAFICTLHPGMKGTLVAR
jgi:plastocyanin